MNNTEDCFNFMSIISYVNATVLLAFPISGSQNNMGLEMLMNMFGGLGAGGLSVPSNPNG